LKNNISGRERRFVQCDSTGSEIRQAHKDIINHHVIAIDQDGYGLDPVTLEPQEDTSVYDRTIHAVIDSAVDGVKAKKFDRIVLFIHGGLNTFSSSIGRAIDLTDSMEKESCYPIFIIWKSEPFSTYWEHLWKVRQGRVIRGWVPRSLALPFVFTTDLAIGLAKSPVVIFANVWTDIKTMSPGFDANLDSIYSEVVRQNKTVPNPIDIYRGNNGLRFWNRCAYFSKYALTFPLKWASDPIIDGLGTPNWDIMLRRTSTLFRTNDEFDISKIRCDSAKRAFHLRSKPTGALSRAMDYLSKKMESDNVVKVDLIGHSMGTIVANNILVNFPDMKFNNIIYMAAACRVKDFNDYVIPYLKNHDSDLDEMPTHFYNLSLHPMAERRETNVSLFDVDLFQRGSLLEWIDNFFSKPNTTEERTFGKYENVMQCIHMIPEERRGQITFKIFGTGKHMKKDPQTHGSFTEFNFWDPKFWSTDATDSTRIRAIPDTIKNYSL
jgi:pimeloyl-ACP methyl ester carboxylesterase